MNVDRYLKKHWINGEYDCWGLVRDVYQHEFSIVLPRVPIDAGDIQRVSDAIQFSEHRSLFIKIKTPVAGCVVEMQRRIQQAKKIIARHVGIYVEPGSVLHNSGVVRCMPLTRIGIDWTITGFFLHVSDSRISQCAESA